MRLALVGGSYQGRSSNAASSRTVNLLKERSDDPRVEGLLVGLHGADLRKTIGAGPIRGMHKLGALAYIVSASKLYSLNEYGTAIELGTLNSATGQVSMSDNGADNGKQVVIADGQSFYVYDATSASFTQTSSPQTDIVDYMDGYVLFPYRNAGSFGYTGIYDASSISSLDFATAEGAPDRLKSLFVDRREIWLLGEETTEVWYNQGGLDNLFARFQGGFIQMGCAATHSVARFDGSLAWLGQNELGQGVPVIARGYEAQVLTTNHPQVAYQIQQYPKIDDAFAYTIQIEGHEFYVLTFPTANATWAYDALEKEWYEWGHIIDDQFDVADPNRLRYNCHLFIWGKHLFGDYANGKIYEMNPSSYTLESTIIPNMRQTIGASDTDEERVRVQKVQLIGEEGVGGDVAIQYSKDGGHTWSTERTQSFGASGDYKARALWRKFGHGRDWRFRFIRKENSKTVYTGLSVREHGE